jgi:fructan beta-fructosidase
VSSNFSFPAFEPECADSRCQRAFLWPGHRVWLPAAARLWLTPLTSRRLQKWVNAFISLLVFTSISSAQDIPIGVFRGTQYDGWHPDGIAFRPGPVSGDLLRTLEIENAPVGAKVASSEVDGDGPTGTLTSPEFTIERKFITFTVAGGNYERHTCVDLLVDGQIARSATGWRSDRLTPACWDVHDLTGRRAQICLVDRASGDWGHINVGPIWQTDTPASPPTPVTPLYQEASRPQFHFTARQWTLNRLNPREREEGWLNDLNGLIYYEGEYHLFAQRWNKCWIHAVSPDLLHWTELPPAFWEDKLDEGVQSGNCVIDYGNTSGLAPDKSKPAMIAFYSGADNRSQCLAYSLDRGRTWTKYANNPFLNKPERDPNVFWYAPAKHWVMMLYGNEQYHIFTSRDLLHWNDEKKPIRDSFECPDFFELPVDGDSTRKKWVLIQGNGKYSLGTFDGREFKEETSRFPCDIGDFYATQTWHNTETGDGRRVQAAWMRFSHFPDMPFSQQVTFPCELTLRSTVAGPRLFRQPIREIATLHAGPPQTWINRKIRGGENLPLAPSGRQFHIKADLEIPPGSKATFRLRGISVSLTTKTLTSDRLSAEVQSPVESVEILLDTTSIETFVNHGELSLTRFVLPGENGVSIRGDGGPVTIRALNVHALRSTWTTPGAQ